MVEYLKWRGITNEHLVLASNPRPDGSYIDHLPDTALVNLIGLRMPVQLAFKIEKRLLSSDSSK